MSINFPVLPDVSGVLGSARAAATSAINAQISSAIGGVASGLPAVRSFPGVANIAGSIQGNILTITDGVGAVAQGLSLSAPGVAVGTVLTTGLSSITDGIGTAFVNIPQSVSNVAMSLSGSLSDLVPDISSPLDGDTVDALVGAGTAKWGIYGAGGALVLEPDSFVSLEYKREWHESDYPIEGGSFESYNKVQLPFEAHVVMTKGGTDADRDAFLQAVERVAESLDLYSIVTPDYTYNNANVTHFDYRRTAESGVSLLTVTLWFQEVRLGATSTFTNTASPTSQEQVNAGNVQTQPATAVEQQTFERYTVSGSW